MTIFVACGPHSYCSSNACKGQCSTSFLSWCALNPTPQAAEEAADKHSPVMLQRCMSSTYDSANNVSVRPIALLPSFLDHQYSRLHYAEEMQKKLQTDADDKRLFEALKISLKRTQERLEEGRVAVQYLELSLTNAACENPGTSIAEKLVLPLLQERLEEGAWQFAEEKARQAQEEIMALLEVSCEGICS